MTEVFITNRPDLWLGVEKKSAGGVLEATFRLKGDDGYVLHWGLSQRRPGVWRPPPAAVWPAKTQAFGPQAVQSPFIEIGAEKNLVLRFDEKNAAPFLVFDLFHPARRRWENNGGQDFYLALSESNPATPSLAEVLDRESKGAEVLQREILQLDSGDELAAAVSRRGDHLHLLVLTDASGPLMLHWGLAPRANSQWTLPPPEIRPPGTVQFDDVAVQTPLEASPQLRRVKLCFPEADAPGGIGFVLHRPTTNEWLKHRALNIFLPIAPRPEAKGLPAIAAQIVDAEMGDHGWTLMHRFNLCHDLIDQVRCERTGWTILFVWLRFSAIRQLDWQRNYNTKPRELTHAQDRLTLKLAAAWRAQPRNRDLIRLALTCVGRGGEGQRIRDEILQIMHRHHIKEVGGTWMEQWHQKLHNNTTPDDVAICEAYLAFLRANGNLDQYFQTLGSHGVTKERLAGFDRPITHNPEFIPHLRDALIWEFENYLKLLKSVHSAGDLETAANAAGHLLDSPARGALDFIRGQFGNPAASARDLVAGVVSVRKNLAAKMELETDAGRLREMLYLDFALEDVLRGVIERNIHSGFSGEQLFELVRLVLENLLPGGDAELAQCHREWRRLPGQNFFTPDWSLHAKAALDRLGRAIAKGIDQAYQEFQPWAEQLGRAFRADEWAVKLFSEEIVRGRPAFVLSLLIRRLDPVLRQSAKLGDWQIISPSTAAGRVEVVETVREIQGKCLDEPTIIVAEKVFGDEEPPENVRAVITPSSVDLVSHVAVRARNASLLFATCYDRECFDQLRIMKGRLIELKVSASGDVVFAEAKGGGPVPAERSIPSAPKKFTSAPATLRVLAMSGFARGLVGGKSFHLKTLAEKLPDWIHTPRSVALPFGVSDAVLNAKENSAVASRCRQLLGEVEKNPAEKLAEIRKCLLELQLPGKLESDLRLALKAGGLPLPDNWNTAALRIRQVWASKWNERAYFSRAARHWPHDAVQMAVLIQEVVAAEHAFVIHTVNPFNGNRDELYVEVVRGLGETLVGNFPGRAFSAVCSKKTGRSSVLAYPAKDVGLFGGGLIFRSDSNAEDLEGYAGAGLYDSVLLEPPREEMLDYTDDKLVWDEELRSDFLGKIVQLGGAVEKAFGSPQDIEGAVAGGKFFVVQSRPQVGLAETK